MPATGSLKPDLLFCEREELGHIAYFLTEWDALRDRGLIGEDVHASIATEYAGRRASIERGGTFRAALARATQFSATHPAEALDWADQAARLDPERPEAPALAVELLRRLGRHDEALALCEHAVERFAALQERLEDLRCERANRPVEDLLARARLALKAQQYAENVTLCEQALDLAPGNAHALVLLAFSQRRLGHEKEALEIYRRLQYREPDNSSWGRWVAELERRVAATNADAELNGEATEAMLPQESPSPPVRELVESWGTPDRALSWKGVTGEFLLDHWQKLILGLGVLLIVVSSNVGVYQLVGPKLWRSEGKCLLALVYTVLCAGFGIGLLRWGAERAGRMMLLATLIVVPANFMLVGQIRLLLEPTAFGLAVALLDAAALFALMRVVTATLGLGRGGLFLAVALFALSAVNAVTARGTPFVWGFAGLLVPAWGYVAAVSWLNTRYRAETADQEREFTYVALILLSLAFLSGAIRTGVYVLRPVAPCLFAVPVMLLAMACVHTAHHLGRFEKDVRHPRLLRFGGTLLAILAFALALSRPPGASVLLSGNTLGTAVLGLVLFATMLRAYRQPAFLYLGFASLFVGYFGAYDFLVELLRAVEEVVSNALGYRHKLPLPFKSLNGLVFNTVLAGLSLAFANRWRDLRLARHCHWLGLPLSVAACILSGFEPKAGVLCLSGYTILYTCAAPLFCEPRLLYPACAAFIGASFFGTGLVPEATTGTLAAVVAGCGLLFSAVRIVLGLSNASPPYRQPLLHAAVSASALVMVLGIGSAGTPASVLAFALVAVLCASLHVQEPYAPIAYVGALSANLAYGSLAVYGASRWQWSLMPGQHALVLSAAALGLAGMGRSLRRAGAVSLPLWPIALAEVIIATTACLAAASVCVLRPTPALLANLSLALALESVALVIVSAWGVRSKAVSYSAIAMGSAAYVAVALAALIQLQVSPLGGWAAIAMALLGLSLYAASRCLPGGGGSILYGAPLRRASLVAVGATWLIAIPVWNQFALVGVALSLAFLTLVAATRECRSPVLAHCALLTLSLAWLCLLEVMTGDATAPPTAYALWLVVLSLLLLVVTEGAGRHVRKVPSPDHEFAGSVAVRRLLFVQSMPAFALAILTVSVSLVAWDGMPSAAGAAVLGLASLAVLWETRTLRERVLVYAGLGLAVASALVLCGWQTAEVERGIGLGWLATSAAVCSVVLLATQRFCRRSNRGELYVVPCVNCAAVLAAAVFALALGARGLSRAAFPVASAGLLVNVFVCVWLAILGRVSAWTFAAAVSFVTATYISLLSVGRPDPKLVYVLGLAAVVQAIGFWSIGWACRRRLSAVWARVFVSPLLDVALALTLLAIPPAYNSPVAMVLVAVAFLLSAKSFPHADWLYTVLGALGCAIYFGWMRGLGSSQQIMVVVGAAYAVWCLGVLLRRYRSQVYALLGASAELGEFPCFHAAVALGFLAGALRVPLSMTRGSAWGEQASLAFALGLLCLLMLAAYPCRAWVHGSIGLCTVGLAMLAAPHIVHPVFWLLTAISVANVFFVTSRAVGRVEPRLRERSQIARNGYYEVLQHWSAGLFAVSATLVGAFVIATTAAATSGYPVVLRADGAAWWAVLLTEFLALFYLIVVGPWRGGLPDLVGRWLGLVLIVWWLGAPASPVAAVSAIDYRAYLPFATATTAFLVMRISLRPYVEARCDLEEVTGSMRAPEARLAGHYLECVAVGLALVALGLTRCEVRVATVGALAIGSLTFGLQSAARRRAAPAYAAAGHCVGACACAALVVAESLGIDSPAVRFTAVALGGTVAAYWLGAVAAGLRRSETRLAIALEQSALLSAALPLFAVIAARTAGAPCGEESALLGVGILMALSVFALALSARWRAEWLVYAAQGLMLAAYCAYRTAFGLTPSTDAAVLTLFGYLDLAAAEVMQRLRLNLYARPTLYFALVMPLVPLGTALADGRLDDLNLLFVFTAATFYGVACYRMQWKTLGYAAAVLYNVFLWIFWARAGYRLADQAPFFLVPVGFSAILFAEVNRGELGRATVNAIRGSGLVAIYLSLAVPIWQFASFGAWLTLLLVSLAAVFAGIGLRVQSFLWLGLVCFVLDVLYEIGRLGAEHALARWAIMLALGILLILFVALNEKKRLVLAMREMYAHVRQWE
ncbi:MAG: tetratricopeptide repeat protein [Isosphaeraceae bacterium]|nr:tetratricopeptide repeat protein [Isosphaeraceae bacterium]